jgi:hypothetical protein
MSAAMIGCAMIGVDGGVVQEFKALGFSLPLFWVLFTRSWLGFLWKEPFSLCRNLNQGT